MKEGFPNDPTELIPAHELAPTQDTIGNITTLYEHGVPARIIRRLGNIRIETSMHPDTGVVASKIEAPEDAREEAAVLKIETEELLRSMHAHPEDYEDVRKTT